MLSGDYWQFYPDIHAAGGLARALEAAFTCRDFNLKPTGFGAGTWASVSNTDRSSQINLGVEECHITSDYWARGVLMGIATQQGLDAHADSIAAWFLEEPTVRVMRSRFPWFEIADGAEEIEAGRGVDYAWEHLDRYIRSDLLQIIPLFEAAARRPQLRELMPFTSHQSLHFSRTIGSPYTKDCAHAIPISNGRFRALGPGCKIVERQYESYVYEDLEYDVIGEGDAEYVIDLIIKSLPPNCGPAILGTEETL